MMRRFVRVGVILLLFPILLSSARTQSSDNLSTVVLQLLDQPAPPREIKEVVDAIAASRNKYECLFGSDLSDPGDDAPINVLIDYWMEQARNVPGKQPSDKVRQRLLEECLAGSPLTDS